MDGCDGMDVRRGRGECLRNVVILLICQVVLLSVLRAEALLLSLELRSLCVERVEGGARSYGKRSFKSRKKIVLGFIEATHRC